MLIVIHVWCTEQLLNICYPTTVSIARMYDRKRFRACSYGGGGPREGEVPRLPVVKKMLPFTCNPGAMG